MNLIPRKQIGWLLVALALIWFANLEYRTLIKPDEGRYAEIPREMVVSGDWVTPRLNDLKYFEKPPLQYWATATAYTLFGEHQWTSRLWTGLTGFAGILLVWFAGLRLFGREAAGYAALLLSSSLLYILMGHINTLDMGVTFFLTLSVVALLIAQQNNENRRGAWMLLAWAAIALAVLSKGLMGLVLPGTALFIYAVVQRDFSVFKRMHWLAGLAVFLLITAPWFYLVMKANPEFFQKFFIYEHYTRFTTKDLGRYQPWYYFIPILLVGALPWTVLMLDTLLRTSLLPALALLMGKHIAEMHERRLFWQIVPVVPVTLFVLWAAANVGKFADTPNQTELYPNYAVWLVVASLVSLLGLLAGMLLLWHAKKLPAIATLALSALLATQIGLSGYNTIARERSAKHIAEAIRAEIKPNVPFYSVLTYEQTLPFYLQRTFTLVQFQDEMAFGIKQEPQRWIPTVAEFAKIWAAQPEAFAIMPVYAYVLLQQQGLAMKIIFEDRQHIVIKKP